LYQRDESGNEIDEVGVSVDGDHLDGADFLADGPHEDADGDGREEPDEVHEEDGAADGGEVEGDLAPGLGEAGPTFLSARRNRSISPPMASMKPKEVYIQKGPYRSGEFCRDSIRLDVQKKSDFSIRSSTSVVSTRNHRFQKLGNR
jgi:hypothetical protein